MSKLHLQSFEKALHTLTDMGQYRSIPVIQHQGKWIEKEGKRMLNLSSNDYLGLASNQALREAFWDQYKGRSFPAFSTSSSRLLTGAFTEHKQLETVMATIFQREACLLFNSGYHANIGILPAIADRQTLIIADKLVHASLIDGIRLSGAKFLRYRHNDYTHLMQLLTTYYAQYERIIIVTESIFSMDGDIADLPQLVALKREFPTILLYVDEAHAIGVYGENGLGMADQQACIADIDFLVGTFGKALASMGAYVICDEVVKQYLINTVRSFIFSTALPPICVAWTLFLIEQLSSFTQQRQHLYQLSTQLQSAIRLLGQDVLSQTCIVPYMIGDNLTTVKRAERLQQQGFYCLPIRPPTVPKETARIRFSLTADMTEQELNTLISCLNHQEVGI
ncbi:8-amino-7-oxononanoate synthase [Pelistega ratti]|uniref:8-amino-7-oxononanoate synthase n=1 Tax=Pelistega ratti TaxID=2652177 RepID=UPI0013581119|nr:8-amino-7-oxononanoate synthase [Pelistega ratti]